MEVSSAWVDILFTSVFGLFLIGVPVVAGIVLWRLGRRFLFSRPADTAVESPVVARVAGLEDRLEDLATEQHQLAEQHAFVTRLLREKQETHKGDSVGR